MRKRPERQSHASASTDRGRISQDRLAKGSDQADGLAPRPSCAVKRLHRLLSPAVCLRCWQKQAAKNLSLMASLNEGEVAQSLPRRV